MTVRRIEIRLSMSFTVTASALSTGDEQTLSVLPCFASTGSRSSYAARLISTMGSWRWPPWHRTTRDSRGAFFLLGRAQNAAEVESSGYLGSWRGRLFAGRRLADPAWAPSRVGGERSDCRLPCFGSGLRPGGEEGRAREVAQSWSCPIPPKTPSATSPRSCEAQGPCFSRHLHRPTLATGRETGVEQGSRRQVRRGK